jgi:hypothetical protein
VASIRTLRAYYYYLTGRAEYLFIHIPKNAGVTIRRCAELTNRIVVPQPLFMAERGYARRFREVMRQTTGHRTGIEHARLRDVSRRVRANLQAVAVVRNPWARVVSRYTYALRTAKPGSELPASRRSFEAFLEERHVWGGREFFWHRAVRGWYPQVDYVNDEGGERPVHVLRAEFLNDEAKRYFGLARPLKSRNISNKQRLDYRTYYSNQTIQTVADWYAADIETFGFDFDKPARKNTFFQP